MHRCGVPLHSRPGLPLSKPHHTRQCDRPIIPHATRAAHRCRPAASRRASQHPKPLQAAPARKPLASRSMMFLPQAKRGGVRRQPWCCLDLAATGRPLVLSREWERTAPHIRRCAKEPYSSHQQKRPPARATGKDPRSARRSHAQQSPKTTPGQLPRHAGKLACLHRQCLTPSAAAEDPPASPCPSRTEESAAPASGDGFPPPAPR